MKQIGNRMWNNPATKLVMVLVFGVLAIAFAVSTASENLKWKTVFKPNMTVQSEFGSLTLEPLDLTTEPGEIAELDVLTRFYARQGQLSHILSADSLEISTGSDSQTISAQKSTVSDLPVIFWVPIIAGFGALLIAGWIWALRSRDLAICLFGLSGLATFLSALPSAVYTTRELALPVGLFRWLEELNAFGASLFGISMLALFIIYPVRLPRWRRWIFAECLIFGTWTLLFNFKVLPGWANINLLAACEMLFICVAIGCQFFATKNDPKSRASLTWLGFSVIIGAGAFISFNAVPLILKITPMNQSYAFLFFLIIYVGLAAGLTQYRLFEVGQWAFRFLFYAAGALVLVLFDAALVFALGMDRLPALGFALLAVGFIYLPLRDTVWRYFSKRGRLETHEMLAGALHVAFAPSSTQRLSRWESLLRKLFDPLKIETLSNEVKKVEIVEDGLSLIIPAIASSPALKLSYPWAGQSLYNPQAQELASQIVSLIKQAESSRTAYDRGVSEERRRMAQDLHDDVGARLLTGLHIADENLRPTLQGAIADIRSIVSGMSGEKISLERFLAELRHEAARRLEPLKVELQWPVRDISVEKELNYRQHKALSSAIREVISNVIRHSQATKIVVQIDASEDYLKISVTDNGTGFSLSNLSKETSGYGLKNLQRRLQDIGGTFQVESLPVGVCICLTIPYECSQDIEP